MKNTPKEDHPHWRKKKLFSFTQEDELRFERLLERAYSVSPGINQSQLIRVALWHLEHSTSKEFHSAVKSTPEPRMGFEPKKTNHKHELSGDEYHQLLIENGLSHKS